MGDGLKQLLERAELEGGDVFTRHDARGWPPGLLPGLLRLGVLVFAQRASCVEPPGCEHDCTAEAEFTEDAEDAVCVFRCPHGCGRVAIPAGEFDRWRLDLAGVGREVGRAIGASGVVADDVAGRLVSVGHVGSAAASREIFVGLGLSRPDARALLLDANRLKASADPFILCAGAAPPAEVWPAMKPAVAVLAEHVRLAAGGVILNIEPLLGLPSVPHPDSASPGWITNKQAATKLMDVVSGLDPKRAAARVSAACSRGQIRTNGRKRAGLRIDRGSFSTWLLEQRESELARSDDFAFGRARPRAPRRA